MRAFNKIIAVVLMITSVVISTSCAGGVPYKEDQVLCDYEDSNCLYYAISNVKTYDYKDYIIDDISDESYNTGTPSRADFQLSDDPMDIDFDSYIKAKVDYAMKVQMINDYEDELEEMVKKYNEEKFELKVSDVYYYDKEAKKSTKLSSKSAMSISYDNQVPSIAFFDATGDENNDFENSAKKIKLSDIIIENSTMDGYLKAMLTHGMKYRKFFRDKEQ